MEQAYTIAATIMRYVFVILMAYILIRLVIISIREWNTHRFWEKQLGQKVFAQLDIIEPPSKRGTIYEIGHKTTVGRGRTCDIQLKSRSIALKHAVFFKKDTMYISAYEPERFQIFVNDSPIGRQDARLLDEDIIKIGRVSFRISINKDDDIIDEDLFDDNEFLEYGAEEIDEDIE
jgi:hypothetical protein